MPAKQRESQPGWSAAKGDAERRANLRFPFIAAIEVRETKSGAKVVGRTSDLGLGGCYVDAIGPFPVGTETEIRIQKGDDRFEAQGTVIYSKIGMGMGLAFTSAQPNHFDLFQRWLAEINGTNPTIDASSRKNEEPVASGVPDKNVDQSTAVLSELLNSLIRKQVLSEDEGTAMLKKLRK